MVTKYRSKPTTVDGIRFASRLEAKRYLELKLLERAKAIKGLRLQPRYPLIVNGKLVSTYVGDFAYFEKDTYVVEDTKGFKTRDYINKRNLFVATHPDIEHREIAR